MIPPDWLCPWLRLRTGALCGGGRSARRPRHGPKARFLAKKLISGEKPVKNGLPQRICRLGRCFRRVPRCIWRPSRRLCQAARWTCHGARRIFCPGKSICRGGKSIGHPARGIARRGKFIGADGKFIGQIRRSRAGTGGSANGSAESIGPGSRHLGGPRPAIGQPPRRAAAS